MSGGKVRCDFLFTPDHSVTSGPTISQDLSAYLVLCISSNKRLKKQNIIDKTHSTGREGTGGQSVSLKNSLLLIIID